MLEKIKLSEILEKFKSSEIKNPNCIFGGEIKTKVDPDPLLE